MTITVKRLGIQDYVSVWQEMLRFTQTRQKDTEDQIWIVEHFPVYTLGLNGKSEHILNTGTIPVVRSDRGGQVTYHGPGQLVVYTLLDLNRHTINIRHLVSMLEQAMISTLKLYGIHAEAKKEAPGVYIQGKKIGSVGLRIKKNCSYHGLSLNNAMDLTPFNSINPCGYSGLKVTQLYDYNIEVSTAQLAEPVIQSITRSLTS